jgi:NADH-quinone oxidoreductase subunit D
MDLDLQVHDEGQESGFETEEMQMSFGPQHPATHGVLRMVVRTDGEIVEDAKCFIGYLHRCFEKHAEALEYRQIIPYTDRMDYVSAITQENAYVLAVEKLLGEEMEVPEKAEYLRIITNELQRIASHLLSFSTYGMDTGAQTPFLHGFRERERVLYLLEAIS